ncbi:hypothetical protein Tco_0083627 [Tanacetum coccineum]
MLFTMPSWKQVTEKVVLVLEDSSETTIEGYIENYKNASQDIRDQLNSKAEAVQIILKGIDNDIYSTVDACPNACEIWKAIKRLKQGESINVQDLETNLYWEFRKFTSRDGESLESYYSRFYKMMNELVRNQCDLKTVSYHKLYDILKQHQNEVNEIRAKRLARTANSLVLVAQQQPVYHPQNHPNHYTQNSSTRSQQAATRNRGKAIVNSPPPTYDQEPTMVAKDDEMSKDKEIDKLMALISLSFKKIYKPTNNNLITSSNTSRANQDNTPRINKGTGDQVIILAKDKGFRHEMHKSEESEAVYDVTPPKDYAVTYSNEEMNHHTLYGLKPLLLYATTFKSTKDDLSESALRHNIGDKRGVNVAGARENVGTQVVQKSMIQCYNCKEYRHVLRECQKPKRAKDATYHKEKMLLCKKEKAGFQLNAEQADWRDDTDDEPEDQKLEAHYLYMAQIQEVTPDATDNFGPIFDVEPLQKQPESVNNTYPIDQDEHNIIIDSLDMSYDREQDDQDDYDLANERDLLASLIEKLKCETDDSKNRNKFLETSNKALVDKLKDLKKFQAELDRYHDVNYASKVAIDCEKAKGDLMSYKMESEKSFNEYTRKINDLNQTSSEMKKELFAHQETISIMSQEKEA